MSKTYPNRARFALALLLAATLIAYLPVLGNGFVWDDRQYIVDNPRVTGGLTVENFRWSLTAFRGGNWHPLTWVSHMLDASLFGPGPLGPHLVNVLLHLANTALLFNLVFRLTGTAWRSLFIAALFALHPLHVESVAWAAERKDVLSTLFGLLAADWYVRYVRAPSRTRYLALAILFALSLAAKPMLVTLPFVLLLLDFWPLGRLRLAAWRGPAFEKLPLLGLSIAASVLAGLAQASSGAIGGDPLPVRISNAAVAYLVYIGKMIAPTNLAVFYPQPRLGWPPWQVAAAMAALGVMTVFALNLWYRRPWLGVGWLWYAGTLVPVIGLVQVGKQAMADRYTYVPAIGIFIILAWGFSELAARRPGWRPALTVAAVAAPLILAGLTARQVFFWRGPESLFTHAAAATQGNWLAHYNLGVHYQELGRTEEAIRNYRLSLEARDDNDRTLVNLGILLANRGESKEAVALFAAAIQVNPGAMAAYINLGKEYMRLGKDREAESLFRQAARLHQGAFEPRFALGTLMLRQQRWAEAATHFGEAVRLNPGSSAARDGLRNALARQRG